MEPYYLELLPHPFIVCQAISIEPMSNEAKLAELRSRTDHDLLILVQRELDRGMALADVATSKSSPLFAQVEKAYDTVKTLLPMISDLGQGDRLRMEGKLKEVRLGLDQVPASANVRFYPASFAS